jgi:hypothetical protein
MRPTHKDETILGAAGIAMVRVTGDSAATVRAETG